MGAWDRSWSVTRTTFEVIRKDREILWFPILSAMFSLLFAAALVVPSFAIHVAHAVGGTRAVLDPLRVVVLFVTYFGLSFIATFFNVCVVHTTRVRLSGGDATFHESIRFALSRAHRIAGWSLVSASLGILLRGLDAVAERSGMGGKILLGILRAVLETAWSISTIFVVPSMVYKDLGPLDAIRDSAGTLKRSWGESLVRIYGLGLIAILCALPCIAVVVCGVVVAASVPAAGFALIALGVLAGIAVFVVFGVADTVFSTVLYHWSTSGVAPLGFDAAQLSSAFRPRAR
jgi:hypothetical protein